MFRQIKHKKTICGTAAENLDVIQFTGDQRFRFSPAPQRHDPVPLQYGTGLKNISKTHKNSQAQDYTLIFPASPPGKIPEYKIHAQMIFANTYFYNLILFYKP
jgi:hypothetical protein